MTTAHLQWTEAEFQAHVVLYARLSGWGYYHTYRSNLSPPGFPDLVLYRDRVLFRELKTEHGVVSKAQERCLSRLVAAGADARVWRPSDWELIERELRR